ncbi:tetratricopeptide repeat protein [Pseudobacteriovorax antillogorgiicola]|uniref:tetratricopeptide repeat protein n=1 Tax=Pseudobacteriovorax antillogorgiicola TaxID=1513793 RepID=UPI0010530A33|nr:hypothetical protein [Pseudobacteriovorax antillogorgiicola]
MSFSESPEKELKLVLGEFEELSSHITTLEPISHHQGLSPYLTSAQLALEKAKQSYTQKEYIAVIRNLNFYLNTMQQPPDHDYLTAQYLLGSSYQTLGQVRKAMRAYQRFLAAFVTAEEKRNPALIPVLQNLLLMTGRLSTQEQQRIRNLISSISSLELPTLEMSRIYFYLALTAKQERDSFFAERLFKKSLKTSQDSRLSAENLYFSAMIPFQAGDYETSQARFQKIIAMSAPEAFQYRNYSYLNLGRIEAIRDHFQTALSYYNRVDPKSLAKGDAIYESVFVHFKAGQYEESLVSAISYVQNYKNRAQIERIKHLMGYLEIKIGQTNEADQSLAKRYQAIQKFERWLRTDVSEKPAIGRADIIEIQDRGQIVSPPPPVFTKAENLFSRINLLQSQLSDIRSEIRSSIFALGQMTPRDFNPSWYQQSHQTIVLAERVFSLSDRLLALEKDAYSQHISPKLKIQLDRSLDRRRTLKKSYQDFLYHRGRWQSWVTLADFSSQLRNIHNQLFQRLAKIRAFEHLNRDQQHHDITEEMLSRGERLTQSIQRALEIVRSRSIRDIANQSHHMGVYKFILDYSQITYEESLLMQVIRDQYHTPAEQHLSQDALYAWQKWEFLVKQLFNQNRSLDQKIRIFLTLKLSKLDESIEVYETNQRALNNLRQTLEEALGKDIGNLLAHYRTAIEEKRSEIMKWKADNQWASYTNITAKRRRSETEQSKIEAKMEEDLKDLEYEVKQ